MGELGGIQNGVQRLPEVEKNNRTWAEIAWKWTEKCAAKNTWKCSNMRLETPENLEIRAQYAQRMQNVRQLSKT